MSIKDVLVTIAAGIALSGIGAFAVSDMGMCGVVRSDGSICQRLAGGKSDCDQLGGKWDADKNCCQIQ
jgi:hypothetical protein